MNTKWQDTFPQEEGYYWFYGWRFDRINRITGKPNTGKPDKPRLHLVDVRKASNSFMYVTDGNFMYESEISSGGKWLKATLPELPNLEDL
jgi:hypothetical protein